MSNKVVSRFDGGDREGALILFMQDIEYVPFHEIELLRSAPNWPARVAAVHTVLREMRGSNDYVFEPAHFRSLTTPTLLLLEGQSPAFLQAVHAALPKSQLHVMPGRQHTAMNTAPELFTSEVLTFLTQTS
jgi:pimeloyl-ACP methyl ester carboxylesterase